MYLSHDWRLLCHRVWTSGPAIMPTAFRRHRRLMGPIGFGHEREATPRTWPRCGASTATAGSTTPTWRRTRSRCSGRWLRRHGRGGAPRAQRDGGRHGLGRGAARRRGWCCSRASTSAASSSTPTTTRARARDSTANPPVLAALPLARPAAPGAGRGHRRAGLPGGERGLLRDPAPRLPARRLGLAAVAGGGLPRRAGRGVPRAPRSGSPPRRRAAAAELGRLPRPARRSWSSGRAGAAGCTTGWCTGGGEGWDTAAAGSVEGAVARTGRDCRAEASPARPALRSSFTRAAQRENEFVSERSLTYTRPA